VLHLHSKSRLSVIRKSLDLIALRITFSANQTDLALAEAEKINTFIFNVRKHVRNAVVHLERLLTLKLDKVEVPTFCCFQLFEANGYVSIHELQKAILFLGKSSFNIDSKRLH
jgi:hypothetical protein